MKRGGREESGSELVKTPGPVWLELLWGVGLGRTHVNPYTAHSGDPLLLSAAGTPRAGEVHICDPHL